MLRLILLLTWAVISSGWSNLIFSNCVIWWFSASIPGQHRAELPTFVDPVLYTKTIWASLSAKCPSGIKKCECVNAVGTFSEGPFDPNDDPLQALITYVGCGPGKILETFKAWHRSVSIHAIILLFQDFAIAMITLKRWLICDLNWPTQFSTFAQRMSLTGKRTNCKCQCVDFYYESIFLRCLCQDGKTRVEPPFDLLKVHTCRPKKVSELY